MRTLATGLTLLLLAVSARGADLKHTIADSVRAIRPLQNQDGTYGPTDRQPLTTIRVVRALATSPDHYTVQEGPFVRGAVDAIVAAVGSGRMDAATRNEALLALNVAARSARYDGSRRDLEAAGAAPSRPDPLEFTRRHLASGEEIDDAGRWFAGVRDRLIAAQAAALESLDVAGIPAAADRMLALNELLAWESRESSRSGGGDDVVKKAPEVARRAAPTTKEAEDERIARALQYLEQAQENGRFGFPGAADAGITAIALSAAMRSADRLGRERPQWVEAGLKYLAGLQKEDGGIYDLGLKNYVTSVAVEALAVAGDEAYAPIIARATEFLTSTQLDEDEGYSAELDAYYGGFGYGSSEKPDLSNSQMAIQALHEAGLSADAAAYEKAVLFLQRCQNRKETGLSEMTTWDDKKIVPGDDGGAVYRPGDSKAGTEKVGDGKVVARSYGSMTYALLKSYLFAGLDPHDPRVADAVDWIRRNYTLEVNPGFERDGQSEYQGLYYYYLTMARALDALGTDTLEAPEGGEAIDWRADLRRTLYELQAEDGHWVNDRSKRWMEGNPVLTTSYALLALAAIED